MPLQIVHRQFDGRPHQAETGVVNQNINATRLVERFLDGFFDRFGAGDVERQSDNALFLQLGQRFHFARSRENAVPPVGKFNGECATDAGRTTGNQNNEFLFHTFLARFENRRSIIAKKRLETSVFTQGEAFNLLLSASVFPGWGKMIQCFGNRVIPFYCEMETWLFANRT